MNTFRELEPIELWSAQVRSGDERLLTDSIAEVATATGFTFFGFFIMNGLVNQTEFHFTRYPRRKYGIVSIERCNEILKILFENLIQKDSTAQVSIDKLIAPYQIRIILGLLEGYDKDEKVHTAEEVSTYLGSTSEVSQAKVYTRGLQRFYTEPAVMLRTDTNGLDSIYKLATDFNQERFTVENFAAGFSHVVETHHVKHADLN